MRLFRTARALLALALAAGAGCSLAIDASDIDEGCPDERKLCDGKCVLIKDPAYGCTRTSCIACAFLNAIPRCDANNQCVPLICLEGYCGADCSVNKLVREDNCGGCGPEYACNPGETCQAGRCMCGPDSSCNPGETCEAGSCVTSN